MSGVHPLIGSKGASSGPNILRLVQDLQLGPVRWVEPFMGSGALYLEGIKAGIVDPSYAVLNDLNGWMIACCRAIRDQPDELARQLALTPLSEAEFNQAPPEGGDDVAIARWWLTRNYMGYVGDFRRSRFTIDHSPGNHKARKWKALPSRLPLLAEAFTGPYLMELDALQFLRRVCTGGTPDLVMVDPPYFGTESSYAAGDFADHEPLAELLEELPAAGVVVTYYDCDELRDLYPENRWHWHTFERPVSTARAWQGQPRPRKTEVVLIRR